MKRFLILIMAASSPLLIIAPPNIASAQELNNSRQDLILATWDGPYLNGNIKLKFERTSSGILGYVQPGTEVNWYPLRNVTQQGDRVDFELPSDPVSRGTLILSADGKSMTGSIISSSYTDSVKLQKVQ